MYQISDPATRFCTQAMKAAGGRWSPEAKAWQFGDIDDAVDALYALYAATRATAVQRDTLESLIEEGLGARAWEVDLDAIDQDSWLASLSREDASRLIGQAIGAAKALCHRPLEDRPPLVQDDRFDTAAFERGLEARRARAKRSQGRRVTQ